MSDHPSLDEDEIHEGSFVDEHIFLILTVDPWYGDIIIYFQTFKVPPHLSWDERRRLCRIAKNYLICWWHFVSPWGWFHFASMFESWWGWGCAEWFPWRGMWWSFIWDFYNPKNLQSGIFLAIDLQRLCQCRSRSVTISRCLHAICACILPHYIRLSSPIPSPSGGLTSWIAT